MHRNTKLVNTTYKFNTAQLDLFINFFGLTEFAFYMNGMVSPPVTKLTEVVYWV